VQGSRIICTDGLIDLGLDCSGYYEIHADGVAQVNPLFRNFEPDGTVTGYGMTCPGRIYQRFLAARNGQLADESREAMLTPMELGFYTTLVAAAAERSLEAGRALAPGVTAGAPVDLRAFLAEQIGADAAAGYGY
jgi:hypothetical protein